ncbi:ras-related protein rab-5c [Anaeramoeba flamelloides]|uniref:Ras-related protein rab-5c n=1 Tax=Anaeramoeba flamelloides TaxID=1746091 RepID=A0AAV7YLB2_9EUKA|nr:ras-related protein rab-5c [Anaeramoeba flamelloides]KAJ6247295.1 ras-related protein rab-5c [Anaeramoeba flamelloides]
MSSLSSFSSEDEEENNQQIKIVLLGSTGVGKTSIALRFTKGVFNLSQRPTIGSSFCVKRVTFNDYTLTLNIWDTAGEEQFQSLAKLYYRDANISILCFDITAEDTFSACNYWYHELTQSGPKDLLTIVIGNKSDLDSKRVVSVERAQEWAKKKNCLYFETSAKSGSNVEELFENICKKYIQKTKERLDDELMFNKRKTINLLKDGDQTKDLPKKKSKCC